MPARKIRVELFDSEGNRYTIAFEGQITREKTVRLLDMVELLGGVTNQGVNFSSGDSNLNLNVSKYEKVKMITQRNFPIAWFSSKEIQTAFEQEFKEPIGLSTVATYLSRLASKGVLTRSGNSNRLKYKMARVQVEARLEEAKIR
jgi:hypothetical protein